jgi:hypothetical protein
VERHLWLSGGSGGGAPAPDAAGKAGSGAGKKKGGDGGRKEVELTGEVHRPVRERGRELSGPVLGQNGMGRG